MVGIYKVEQIIINIKKKILFSTPLGLFTDLKKVSRSTLATEKIQDIRNLFFATKPKVNGRWPLTHKKLLSLDGKVWKSEADIRKYVETEWGLTNLHAFTDVKSIDAIWS